MTGRIYLKIAIQVPLRRSFDYLPPLDHVAINQIQPGMRALVPFGKKKTVIGIIIALADRTEINTSKLRRVKQVLDDTPLISADHLQLLLWASRYYHYPVGQAIFEALPSAVNSAACLKQYAAVDCWRIEKNTAHTAKTLLSRAPKQRAIYHFLQEKGDAIDVAQIAAAFPGAAMALNKLAQKKLVNKATCKITQTTPLKIHTSHTVLNVNQQSAIAQIKANIPGYHAFLLEGVTGSGKTEVYLEAIKHTLKKELQVLVLLPEIALTPQLIRRFQDRFDAKIVVQHSNISHMARYKSWLKAGIGAAHIVLGTRSAVWTPLAKPGLYIVDEEHDLSYKQQEKFRYSARDIALVRAKRDAAPIILGSATPSMESLRNSETKKYYHLSLPIRAGVSQPVQYNIIDLKACAMHGAISAVLAQHMKEELEKGSQILLFLNRRGYAHHFLCHVCGWKASCTRCNQPYTYHKSKKILACHHCDAKTKQIITCPQCATQKLCLVGHGTERIEENVAALFPAANIVRIDRDTTQKKQDLPALFARIDSGAADIIIGTQMLAKGHHFPNITLTGIIDADRGLFSNDYRAAERLAQLLIQVSGRTGRAEKKGQVFIQTHYPGHTLLKTLTSSGYSAFAKEILAERQATALPPYSYHALLRAASVRPAQAETFLSDAKRQLIKKAGDSISILGPIIAPIEKRAGLYRMQLLLQSDERAILHAAMGPWLSYLEESVPGKKVRWSIDIDPLDML